MDIQVWCVLTFIFIRLTNCSFHIPPRNHPSTTTRPVVLHTIRHHHTDKGVIRPHHVTTNAIIYQPTSLQKNVTVIRITQPIVSNTQRIIVPTSQRQHATDSVTSITTRGNQTNAKLIDVSDQETVIIVGSVCGTIVVMLLSVFLIFIVRKRICFSQPTKNHSFRHTRNNPGYDLQNDFTPTDTPKPTTHSKVVYNAKDTPERVNIGVQQRDSENDVYTFANLASTDTDFDKNENLNFTVNRDITSNYDHGYFQSTDDDNDAYDHAIHGSVLPNNNDNIYDHTIRRNVGPDIDGTYDHTFGPTTDDDYDVTRSYKKSMNYDSNYNSYDSYQS